MKEYTKQTKITKPFVLLHCSSHRPFTNKQKSPCTLPPPCVLLFPPSRIASRRNIPDAPRCYCSVSLTLTHPYTAATTTIALTLCSRRALNFAHSLSLSLALHAYTHASIPSITHSDGGKCVTETACTTNTFLAEVSKLPSSTFVETKQKEK